MCCKNIFYLLVFGNQQNITYNKYSIVISWFPFLKIPFPQPLKRNFPKLKFQNRKKKKKRTLLDVFATSI